MSRYGRSDSGMTTEASPLTGGMKVHDPLWIWAVNNTLFVIMVAIALFLGYPVVGVILTFVNSAVDLYYTWPYYFPSLVKIRDSSVTN